MNNFILKKRIPDEKLIRIVALSLFALVMLHAGFSKFFGGSTPEWFLKQFDQTPLNIFDGALNIHFFIIAFSESLLGIFSIVGLFLNRKNILAKNIDSIVFLGSAILFISLCMGQRLTHKFDDAAFLFFYSVASLAMLSLIQKERQLS